jgi:tetratricopeptide (TPR) repeat protein
MSRRIRPDSWTLAVLLALVPLLWGFDPFHSSNGAVEEGNAKLGARKFKEALEHYDKAGKELPDHPGVQYNRGIALSRLGQLDKAREALVKGTLARDRRLRAKSFYNLGNVLMEQKKYEEAAEAFKSSLRLNHRHLASKWNLELALRMIEKKKKEEEKKKKEEEKKKKDKKDDQDKQDKQNQQNQQDKQDKQDKQKDQAQQKKDQKESEQQDKQDEQQDKKKGQQQKPQPSSKDKPKPSPSKKRMNAVLDALDRNDKNLQRRRAKMQRRGFHRPVKDW